MPQLTAGMTVAGRFRLVQTLGAGGNGAVWAAEEEGVARRVALKFSGPGDVDGTVLRAEFEQARRLVHPGILRVTEFLHGPPACMVMQHAAGGDLGALRGASVGTILPALMEIAEALDHAHRQGVIHRDLKPANVLRDTAGRWLVADFGSGAWARGGSLPGMSPQQLDGASPAPTDDVYGLGALAFELLAGQPLFHPDLRAERIREEAPVIPATDLTGRPLPAPLRALLAAMLAKNAARRPPSVAAVRTALAEIMAELAAGTPLPAGETIVPLPRRPVAAPAPALPGPAARRRGLSAALVYGGLGLLVVVAALVIGYLPSLMRDRPALVGAPSPAVPAPAASVAVPAAAPAPVPAEQLDAALGEFLRLDDDLKKARADQWGGADWSELRRQAQAADTAYRERDGAGAVSGYRAATALGRALLARAPKLLAESLAAGEAALLAGRQADATAAFTTALAVAPEDAAARRGLERAGKLDRVRSLVAQAGVAESAGRRDEALGLYRQAAALDAAWPAANAGVARLSQAAARDSYETQMARGLAAQAAGRLAPARAAFAAALQARPGDAAAQAALTQLEADQKLAQLSGLQAEARAFEQAERWADALQRYEALLAADANLSAAQEGRARARARLELDTRLRREIANADHFNDDAVLARARALLATAQATPAPGPVLTQQLADLGRLVAIGATPVPVVLESDNLTEVTIFKVGRLGAFSSRTLELRPGTYTAVGARPGYRDVRRNFRVAPDGARAPVVVRCEEAI